VPSSIRKLTQQSTLLVFLLIPTSVKLPKSFVAIDLSEKVPEAFERSNSKGKEHNMTESEERGRAEERANGAELLPIADANGEISSPGLEGSELKDISPTSLPSPALDITQEQ